MCKFLVTGCFIFQAICMYSQGQIDSVPKVFVRNENSLAGELYTNGWGVSYSYVKMINAKLKRLYSVDFAVIRDPKEIKLTNPIASDNNNFVYGKTYFLANFRFTYGGLFSLYQKKDVGGIEIRYYYMLGLLLGFHKPVYYNVVNNNNTTVERFSIAAHPLVSSIQGKASFFKGFNEINIIPGIHIKSGFSFEFGTMDLVINAIEGGFSIDVFPRKIELMANDQNNYIFPSLFLALRFGRITNSHLRSRENSLLGK